MWFRLQILIYDHNTFWLLFTHGIRTARALDILYGLFSTMAANNKLSVNRPYHNLGAVSRYIVLVAHKFVLEDKCSLVRTFKTLIVYSVYDTVYTYKFFV